MEKAKQFFKREPVFVIAAVCAVASMFAVPPSADYLGYIDLRVLELLFCLMAAVAGMQAEGSFLVLSQRLLTLLLRFPPVLKTSSTTSLGMAISPA